MSDEQGMRLYHATNFRFCISCGGTQPACQSAQERGLVACCPDCDHGVPVVPVPWCETHNVQMLSDHHSECARWQLDYEQDSIECPCKLQVPPKVWRQE